MNTITIFKVITRIGDEDCEIGEVAAETVALAEDAARETYALKVHCKPDREVLFGKDKRDLSAEANSEAQERLAELEYAGVLKGNVEDDPISSAAKRRARVSLGKE